jgi:hypothetical protein
VAAPFRLAATASGDANCPSELAIYSLTERARSPFHAEPTHTKTVVLAPTDVTFMINVAADVSVPIEQVLAAVDFGLTVADIMGVNSYPMPPFYSAPSPTRTTYTFRLTVAANKMKDTIDKLEKLRKSTDTGVELTYSTSGFGPTAAAIEDAREKALPELMANARKQAQSLATAAQLKLGAIQSVTEGYTYPAGYSGPVQPIVSFSAIVRFAAQ